MNAVRGRHQRPLPAAVEFDTFRVAVGLAVIVGALALVAPYLTALTAVLAALAAAGWAAGRARDRSVGGLVPGHAWGLLVAALGAGAFFLLVGPLQAARGLALALSLVPLWWVERSRASRRAAGAPGGP